MKKLKGMALLLAIISAAFLFFWGLQDTSAARGKSESRNAGFAPQNIANNTQETVQKVQANNHELSAEMQGQLTNIAKAYAQNAKFPTYAIPLSADDWQLLNPQALVPRKAALSNMPKLYATVILDRYIIDRSTEQPVSVHLSKEAGFDNTVSVTGVHVWLQQSAKGGKRTSVVALSGIGDVFSGVLPVALLRSVPTGETVVMVQLMYSSGEHSIVTAMVKLFDSASQLVRVGDAYVGGVDLVIPMYFAVNNAGNYLVAANLYRADTNEPVSHVSAEMTLSQQNNSGLLKVHAATLRAKQAAGPYVLKDFDIARMSDVPGELTTYGSSKFESFAVRGFALSSYSNEPYYDPAVQQKLEFLQKLAAR